MVRLLGLAVILILLAPCAFPQSNSTPVVKDPQAIAILNQSLAASGGLSAISAIQDYTGSGTITYFWAGEEIQAPVTVRGMGTGNFRIDATLPEGTRTNIVDTALTVLGVVNTGGC